MKLILNHLSPVGFESSNPVHLLIEDGIIQKISPTPLSEPADKIIENCYVSPGFTDIGALSGEPGYEDRETLGSLCAAASQSGYTRLAIFPNTKPCLQQKADVKYIHQSTIDYPVTVDVLAALTIDTAGKEMSEMFDLHRAGVLGFTDGLKPLTNSKLLSLALEYSRSFNGLILHHPLQYHFTMNGLMHEGSISTAIGMRGIPDVAEEILVQRDIAVQRYSGGRLHLYGISSQKTVALVRQAKQEGLDITCSVPVLNLIASDASCLDFDTNFKVHPPLRDEATRQILLEGLADGTIDTIVSGHVPLTEEDKNLEFQYAEFGAATLGYSAYLARLATSEVLRLEQFIEKIALNPRKILSLDSPKIKIGTQADFTLFSETTTNISKIPVKTSAYNIPIFDTEAPFQIEGTIHKGKVVLA